MKTSFTKEHGIVVSRPVPHETVKVGDEEVVCVGPIVEIQEVDFHATFRSMPKFHEFTIVVSAVRIAAPLKDRDGEVVQLLDDLYIIDLHRELNFPHLDGVQEGSVGRRSGGMWQAPVLCSQEAVQKAAVVLGQDVEDGRALLDEAGDL